MDNIRLNLVSGIGPINQRALLSYFGSAGKVMAASLAELEQVPGIGPKLANQIQESRDPAPAQWEWSTSSANDFRILLHGTDEYPTGLREMSDAPLILYCRGRIEPRDELAVAIVGSRRCTMYGRQQAEKLGRSLAMAGVTIVSGMARGIDAAAHRGALEAGGRTIAVSATGLLEIYPPEHKELARQIAASGAVVTENRLGQKPSAGLFPQRNRIISGLSHGVIIIEANQKSGALHTARHAYEQGREVMVLPANVDSIASIGSLNLLRDGATLIRHADDVLEALGPLVQPVQMSESEEVRSPRELTLSEQELAILNLVHTTPRPVDEVLRESPLETSRVLATLTVLEMKRMVRRLPGGMVMRVTN
jgi:DNA processing protein